MKTLVSVCMPTYNRQAYLAEAIESIRGQKYDNWELIICNDGSTDRTYLLLDYYTKKDKRIKVITTPNQGIAKARNTAIRASKGGYIMVMDSDDLASPDRITDSLKAIKHYDFVFGPYLQADEHAKVQGAVNPPPSLKKEQIYDVLEGAWPHVTIMAKRQCFIDNPYRDELKVNDDAALCLDWYKAGYKGVRLKDAYMIVRYHPTSVSKTRDKEVKEITKKLRAELDAYIKSKGI